MTTMQRLLGYCGRLTPGREILWCYLIWYLVMVVFNFDGSLRIWLTSLGVSAVIGTGLVLSVAVPGRPAQLERWQRARLYLMPFGVSSFSAVVKDRGFLLIFSPRWLEDLVAVLCCTAFALFVFACKQQFTARMPATEPPN